jgi:hypothetical protein
MPGMPDADRAGWRVTFDGRAFLTANLQERKFRDFHQIESQNWFMAAVARRTRAGTVTFSGMTSLEPWTLRDIGSAQVFQTGETYQGASIVDYQHPHDLVMGAGVRFDALLGAWRLVAESAAVGAPALGPDPFMHRASAEGMPTAPLAHHGLDATHVSHGVVTLGLGRGPVLVEASAFHGREPDEDRVRVEFGPLDSYAARLRWTRAGWDAQVSGAYIKFPDPTEFTDHHNVTASVSRNGTWRSRPLVFTAAFAWVRETAFGLDLPAWLFEAAWTPAASHQLFARAEWLKKDILTRGGYDPPDFPHLHVPSRIGALTAGYARALARGRAGAFDLAADVTVHAVDENLADAYGRPYSVHAYLRWHMR